MTNLRICNEISNLKTDPPLGISISVNDDLLNWDAIIMGPNESVWEGGIFQLKITINSDYPHKPPIVKFLTPMFHPNIYRNGNICLDILQDKWSPVYDIKSVLLSIQSLLTDPNPDDPLIVHFRFMSTNKKMYDNMFNIMVKQFGGNANRLLEPMLHFMENRGVGGLFAKMFKKPLPASKNLGETPIQSMKKKIT